MEPIYRQTFLLDDHHVDRYGRAKPSTVLYMAQEAAGQHCRLLGADWDVLSQNRLFWAVTRQRVQVTRLPVRGETVTVETWPMPTTRVAYPRSTVAYDAQGNELFRAVSLWVLMDMDTRALVLPGKSGVLVEGALRGTELSVPASLHPAVMEHCVSRSVQYSELDRNGHMNNTYYLNWSDDLLSSDFHRAHPAQDLTVCYLSEAREGEALQLRWDLFDGPALQVDAFREKTDVPGGQERVFSVLVRY